MVKQCRPRKNAVELSLSGAADFVGQGLIALEDGKPPFLSRPAPMRPALPYAGPRAWDSRPEARA